jgi:hypothetical protein
MYAVARESRGKPGNCCPPKRRLPICFVPQARERLPKGTRKIVETYQDLAYPAGGVSMLNSIPAL